MKPLVTFLLFASVKLLVSSAELKNSHLPTPFINESLHRSSRQIIIGPVVTPSPEESTEPPSSDDSSKGSATVHLPQINFYSSVPNSLGVVTNGLLWLRELSAAMGTPLPILIGAIPMAIFSLLLIFLPDLTTLGLPLFYPSGATGDPLSAFPPLPEFSFEDFPDLETIKNSVKQFMLVSTDIFK